LPWGTTWCPSPIQSAFGWDVDGPRLVNRQCSWSSGFSSGLRTLVGCSVKCDSSLVTSESVRSGMCSFNRNTTWTTSSPLTNPDAQYRKIVSRGFRENLVAEKRCSNGHPTPSEATYITAERQKRQQLRHCSRFVSNVWLFLFRCAVCCINRHGQSTWISHKKVAGRHTSPCSRRSQSVPNASMLILTTDSGSGHLIYSSDHRGSLWLFLLARTDPPDRVGMPACRTESSDLVGKRAVRLSLCLVDSSLVLSATLCGVLHFRHGQSTRITKVAGRHTCQCTRGCQRVPNALNEKKHNGHTRDGGVCRGWPVNKTWRRELGESLAFPHFAHQTQCTSPPPPSTGACGPRQATNERNSALCRYPPYGAPPQNDGHQAALTGESSSKFASKTRHGQKT